MEVVHDLLIRSSPSAVGMTVKFYLRIPAKYSGGEALCWIECFLFSFPWGVNEDAFFSYGVTTFRTEIGWLYSSKNNKRIYLIEQTL